MKCIHAFLLTLAWLHCSADDLFAQNAQPTRVISAQGSESIIVPPQRLRLVMWIKAQAKDSDGALTFLTEHKQRVREELEALKADKASVIFSAARISHLADEAKSSPAFMQQIFRMGNPRAKPQTAPVVCTARCAVKADWLLPKVDDEELARLQVTLREQIALRDLAGDKNKANLTVEEQNFMDELEQNSSRYSSSTDLLTGGGTNAPPRITFLAKASDEQYQVGMAKAYEKAMNQAGVLASASGHKLGKLSSVSMIPMGVYNSAIQESLSSRNTGRAFPPQLLIDEVGLISAPYPDELIFNIGVNLGFNVEP